MSDVNYRGKLTTRYLALSCIDFITFSVNLIYSQTEGLLKKRCNALLSLSALHSSLLQKQLPESPSDDKGRHSARQGYHGPLWGLEIPSIILFLKSIPLFSGGKYHLPWDVLWVTGVSRSPPLTLEAPQVTLLSWTQTATRSVSHWELPKSLFKKSEWGFYLVLFYTTYFMLYLCGPRLSNLQDWLNLTESNSLVSCRQCLYFPDIFLQSK